MCFNTNQKIPHQYSKRHWNSKYSKVKQISKKREKIRFKQRKEF